MELSTSELMEVLKELIRFSVMEMFTPSQATLIILLLWKEITLLLTDQTTVFKEQELGQE